MHVITNFRWHFYSNYYWGTNQSYLCSCLFYSIYIAHSVLRFLTLRYKIDPPPKSAKNGSKHLNSHQSSISVSTFRNDPNYTCHCFIYWSGHYENNAFAFLYFYIFLFKTESCKYLLLKTIYLKRIKSNTGFILERSNSVVLILVP